MPLDQIEPLESIDKEPILRDLIEAIAGCRRSIATKTSQVVAAWQAIQDGPLSVLDMNTVLQAIESQPHGDLVAEFVGIIERFPRGPLRQRWFQLYKFLFHDITHIDEGAIQDHAIEVAYTVNKAEKPESAPMPEEWAAFYREAIKWLPHILRQTDHPFRFVQAIAEMELGVPVSEIETVDIAEMIRTIAKTHQIRFADDDYVITDQETRQPERNEIVLDLSPSQLETNPGMLWSVIYNLCKNAGKELACKHEPGDAKSPLAKRAVHGEMPENPIKLHVKSQNLPEQGVTIIHIMDSGDGLSVDEIMSSIKDIIRNNLLQASELKESTQHILQDWSKNPFAVRALQMGDIYDLAGLARVSGFVTSDRSGSFSSGMGLWGATYLTQQMGGEILYTNTADGGALFTVILPNHYLTGGNQEDLRKHTQDIRHQLEQGTGFLDTLPLAA